MTQWKNCDLPWFWQECDQRGSAEKADCLITGDIGHHEGLDANEMGLTILDASHYGLEHIFMHIMYEYLKGYCMDVEIGIADVGVPFSVL